MTYTVKIKQFEGPFDLLLFFIERDELDINDIPISKITDDFLAYLKKLESMNIDVASEFILVAATLMKIKARMLIPRKHIDEQGNEIDPREELVQRLLEYKKFKSVLDDFRSLEAAQAIKVQRGNIVPELKKMATKALVDVELESLNLFNLLKAFEAVIDRYEHSEKVVHHIARYNYTIKDQQTQIFAILNKSKRADFTGLFSACENRIHAIVTFLALLELVNHQKIKIIGGTTINSFWIEEKENGVPD